MLGDKLAVFFYQFDPQLQFKFVLDSVCLNCMLKIVMVGIIRL